MALSRKRQRGEGRVICQQDMQSTVTSCFSSGPRSQDKYDHLLDEVLDQQRPKDSKCFSGNYVCFRPEGVSTERNYADQVV